MESPMNMQAPITPSASSGQLCRPNARCPSAISDSVPPSPLLSARSSSSTYLAVTTMKSAHRIRLSTPSTSVRVTGWPSDAAATASRNAYSGEVPISPNTTPMLPSVSAQKPDVTDPSRASLDVTPTAIPVENALSVDLIPSGYRRFSQDCQPIGPDIGGITGPAGKAAFRLIIQGNMAMWRITV